MTETRQCPTCGQDVVTWPESDRMHIICGQFHKPTDPCTGPVVITRSTADHIAAARLAVKRVEYAKPEARATDDVSLPREDET